MDQKIITLFDTYTHGGMSRRAFLDKLTLAAGSAAAATALLPLLENNYAFAAMVPENDPRLTLTEIADAAGLPVFTDGERSGVCHRQRRAVIWQRPRQ